MQPLFWSCKRLLVCPHLQITRCITTTTAQAAAGKLLRLVCVEVFTATLFRSSLLHLSSDTANLQNHWKLWCTSWMRWIEETGIGTTCCCPRAGSTNGRTWLTNSWFLRTRSISAVSGSTVYPRSRDSSKSLWYSICTFGQRKSKEGELNTFNMKTKIVQETAECPSTEPQRRLGPVLSRTWNDRTSNISCECLFKRIPIPCKEYKTKEWNITLATFTTAQHLTQVLVVSTLWISHLHRRKKIYAVKKRKRSKCLQRNSFQCDNREF